MTLGGRADATARLLLIAQDRPADVISELGLPVRNVPRSTMTVIGVDIAWTAARIQKHFGGTLGVLNLPQRGHLGMFFPSQAALHVRLIKEASLEPGSPAELSLVLGLMRRGGLLPADMPLNKLDAAVWYPPAGVAWTWRRTWPSGRC